VYRIVIVTVLICLTFRSKAQNRRDYDLRAAAGLVRRIAPGSIDHFKFEKISAVGGMDVFELESVSDKVVLRGNSANSMALAFNYYLKYYCHTEVTWYTEDEINIPRQLPAVPALIRKESSCRNRFFLNYCTFGYSLPWWRWKDWERLIDWMALNGINMPLAITGEEAIWYRVWRRFGLTDREIRGYFTGPAYLPWHRMSNLDTWAGPLPASYLDYQLVLQKKILDRERSLNMRPVLPAFAGHVPKALMRRFPSAHIKSLGPWGGFGAKYGAFFLDPLDPMFRAIQKQFLKEQTRQYGTDHIYGADPFNEVTPPSWDPGYLRQVSRTIYTSMKEQDSCANWLMMTWIFYFERDNWTNERVKAFLEAVPNDKLILLDYYCEKSEVWKLTEAYYGRPFIWCYLGNFGGNTMLAGNLAETGRRLANVFDHRGVNLSGVGSTLEGFDVNPIMYEYVFERAWEPDHGLTNWVNAYADRQVGRVDSGYRSAWQLLADSVYVSPARLGQATLTDARPSLTGNGNWTTDPAIDYRDEVLFQVWKEMTQSAARGRGPYYYGLANVGRQVLGNYFSKVRARFSQAYQNKDLSMLKKERDEMLGIMDDMDRLLSTQSSFLLGKWLSRARACGRDERERNYYERNARMILTTWGRKGQSLNDYANRAWAGLVRGYYKARWAIFTSEVIQSVAAGKAFDEIVFRRRVTDFEWEWVNRHDKYPSKPKGDAYAISIDLISKYGP
jgi:alpha-N-acetylglucosaminidase